MSILYRSVKNDATNFVSSHLLGRHKIHGARQAPVGETHYGKETGRQGRGGNRRIQRHRRFDRQAVRGGRRVGGGELRIEQERRRSRGIGNHRSRRKGRGGAGQRLQARRRRSAVRRNQ